MTYDVLLFDLDDTLLDFAETEKNAFSNSFLAAGLPNALNDYRPSYRAISKTLWDDLEQGHITLAQLQVERFKQLFQAHALDLDPVSFGRVYLENLGKEVHIINGVTKMLARCANYRLAVVTNGFKDVQRARIDRSALHNTFEAIITSEEAGYDKPQKEIFNYTFEKLKIADKSRVLMIGDSLSSDIRGGNLYGIDTCWFNPQRKKNLTAIQPTYEIHCWDDFFINGLSFQS